MTVHDLHDALNLLPDDLLAAADRVRTSYGTKRILWRRLVPIAACLVLLLSTGLAMQRMGMGRDKMSAAEAPAAMAPAPMEAQKAEDIVETPAAEMEPGASPELPAENAAGSSSVTSEEKGPEKELFIDHSHRFAEETETDKTVAGYCGNMMTRVSLDGVEYAFAGSDSIAVTDILIHLNYDPEQVCRCAPEFTVDTETLTGIQVNLTEAFARCEKGQAALTEAQVTALREVIEKLK